jgi:hypothetical protein
MADSEEVKEEAKEEGESSADKIARLERSNEEMRQGMQASLREASEARGQVQVILDQIQRAAASGEVSPERAAQATRTLKEKFDDDPMGAVNELFTMRMGPVIQEYFGREADNNRDLAHARNPDLFKKYGREVEEFMRDMPMDVKAKPGSYEAALKYVRSQHLEEEVEEARKQEREKAAQPEGASAAESKPKERRVMAKEEREIMKAFDMSEDDWDRYSTPGGIRPEKAKKRA